MTTREAPPRLSDADLLAEVKRVAATERSLTAHLIRLLCEVEDRRLHLTAGCSSLFTYCTQILRLSEHAAYARIAAARAARQCPLVLDLLERGEITLTTITLVGRHLTPENHVALLDAVRGKSKQEVEAIVAEICPYADLPTIIRAIGPDRYELRIVVSGGTLSKLRCAQDLLRHAIPNGDEAEVLDRALSVLISQWEKAKYSATERPRSAHPAGAGSRHVPAAVRRAVRERDGDRCAYVGSEGRCTETAFLEYHHRLPFAEGGDATVENIELRCRAHNVYEAERWFGPMLAREEQPEWGSLNSVWTEFGPS